MVKNSSNGANLGFEKKLWQAADKMRDNMDAAEYKHVVLGLIFLKYISDAFTEQYDKLKNDPEGLADPEEPDEYKAENIFWVPKKARWNSLQDNAKKPEIGKFIDNAMDAIEKDNPSLKGVLPKNYARPALNKQRLGELIDLIGTIGLGDEESRSKDILGRVYEYFLGEFADAEGKKGGQFYTPRCIVKLLVEMIEPYKGRVFDPCCGSGGMFVQSEKFIEAHGGRLDNIHILGQESNQTTWRLCKMNLAIRGIESSSIKWENSFHEDQHKDLRADFILANPPFNDSDWNGQLLREDVRWKYGVPPTGNANFAWVQNFIYHLSPNGSAGFVLANASLSTTNKAESGIRKRIIEEDLVDCIILLPKQLFYNTMIPACLWFIAKDKKNSKYRGRSGEILFIDARNLGQMVDRRHKELSCEDINKIVNTYHSWRNKEGKYQDIIEFCRSVQINNVKKENYDLTPIRHIKINLPRDYKSDLEKNLIQIHTTLNQRAKEFKTLEDEAKKGLSDVGYKNLKNTLFSYSSNINLSNFIGNIYIKWFIKYDFPDENNKPYKSSGGKLIYLEEIEQEIPIDWEILPIDKIVKIIDCLHTKKPSFVPSQNILLQFFNVGEFGLLDLSKLYTVSKKDYEQWTKNILLKEGDCIITNAGKTGVTAQIPYDFFAGLGRNITAIRPIRVTQSYLIYYLLYDNGEKQIRKNIDVGTIFDTLNVKGIKKFKIILPSNEIMNKFENIVRPLRKIMEKNAYEKMNLNPKEVDFNFVNEKGNA